MNELIGSENTFINRKYLDKIVKRNNIYIINVGKKPFF